MTRDEAAGVLRGQRLGRGLSVDDVAKATLLKGRVIEEFETGQAFVLDGYHKSYLRRYAEFLGVDGNAIVVAYTGTLAVETPEPERPGLDKVVRKRRPRSGASIFRRKRRLIPVAVASILILVVAVGLLANPPPFLVPEQPGNGAPTDHEPPATDVAPTDPTPPPDAGTGTSITTVKFSAMNERAWLEIRADGRVVFSGTLRPGDTTEAAGEYVVVIFGNAMHTHVSVNGQDQGLVSTDRTVMTQEYGIPDSHGP
jgi:cytoskeletal protein RodZ